MKKEEKKNKDENENLYHKEPSFFQMAKNFATSAGKHIANGMKAVTQEVYVDRLDTCNKCPHVNKEKKRCGLCGCMLEHKAKWETAECPDTPSRWNIKSGYDEEVDYPRTGGLSPDTGPRN